MGDGLGYDVDLEIGGGGRFSKSWNSGRQMIKQADADPAKSTIFKWSKS